MSNSCGVVKFQDDRVKMRQMVDDCDEAICDIPPNGLVMTPLQYDACHHVLSSIRRKWKLFGDIYDLVLQPPCVDLHPHYASTIIHLQSATKQLQLPSAISVTFFSYVFLMYWHLCLILIWSRHCYRGPIMSCPF